MDSLRMVAHDATGAVPCCRCGSGERNWDRIGGKVYCPQCEEAIVLGECEPLVERTEQHACAVCGKVGTLCYRTFPLHATNPLEIDLCPDHFRCLMGRRLGPFAFHQLGRKLSAHGLAADEVFMLHSAFYDASGRALQPIPEVEG
jgi:hypothetical protein